MIGEVGDWQLLTDNGDDGGNDNDNNDNGNDNHFNSNNNSNEHVEIMTMSMKMMQSQSITFRHTLSHMCFQNIVINLHRCSSVPFVVRTVLGFFMRENLE